MADHQRCFCDPIDLHGRYQWLWSISGTTFTKRVKQFTLVKTLPENIFLLDRTCKISSVGTTKQKIFKMSALQDLFRTVPNEIVRIFSTGSLNDFLPSMLTSKGNVDVGEISEVEHRCSNGLSLQTNLNLNDFILLLILHLKTMHC